MLCVLGTIQPSFTPAQNLTWIIGLWFPSFAAALVPGLTLTSLVCFQQMKLIKYLYTFPDLDWFCLASQFQQVHPSKALAYVRTAPKFSYSHVPSSWSHLVCVLLFCLVPPPQIQVLLLRTGVCWSASHGAVCMCWAGAGEGAPPVCDLRPPVRGAARWAPAQRLWDQSTAGGVW